MTNEQKEFLTGRLSEFILREQGTGFAMNVWLCHPKPGKEINFDRVKRIIPSCGTIACIGGSAEYLLFPEEHKVSEATVIRALGLTYKQGMNLFYGDRGASSRLLLGWPQIYQDRYALANTPLEKAEVVIHLLKLVAETDGTCLNPE